MRKNLPRRPRRGPSFEFGESFRRAAKDFPPAIRQGRNGVAKQFAGGVGMSCRHFHLLNAKRVCSGGRWRVKDAPKDATLAGAYPKTPAPCARIAGQWGGAVAHRISAH